MVDKPKEVIMQDRRRVDTNSRARGMGSRPFDKLRDRWGISLSSLAISNSRFSSPSSRLR